MFQIMIFSITLSFISMFLLTFNLIISKKSFQDREKTSPFECGFDPMSSPRLPFSMHFFTISLIFLIFDIEITLLIPLIFLTKNFNFFSILLIFIFLLILILGLFIEYSEQSIDWKI